MPFEGFLHPALAAGAALAAVPLVIHLLNRQRHRPLAWGAMRFVMAAHRRTRRRTQLESLLLLLLRMAAVALLAFALSRPFTDTASPLAPLTESRRDVVLLIDGSASTGYRENVDSVFERVVDRARGVLLDLDGSRGDRVRLLLCGAWPRLLSWRTPEEALSILGTLTHPTDEPLELPRTLAEVARLAEEEAAGLDGGALEVRLLTDMQRTSFAPSVDPASDGGDPAEEAAHDAAPTLAEALDRLNALGLHVVVEDLGPPAVVPANLGVTSVEPLAAPLGPQVTTEVAVTVANRGPRRVAGVRVALSVNGERRPTRSVEIEARDTAQVVFPVSFRTDGHHLVEAEIEGDALAFDDRRSRVVWVPPTADVLLVDGDPDEADLQRDEVGLAAAVLEPPEEPTDVTNPFRPFRPSVVFPEALSSPELDLADYEVVVLANTPSLPPRAVERLETHVGAGAGLLVTAGSNAMPEALNHRLWRSDESGLLPARLVRHVQVSNRRERYFRVGEFAEEHPALAFFADEPWRPLLTEVPVYEFLESEPIESARVLARLDDEGRNPLLVERAYDRGRVLLWTTTLDRAWTRLPESPRTLVPLLHELVRYASRAHRGLRNVDLGAPLLVEQDAFPRLPALVRPDGTRADVETEPEPVGGGAWRLVAATETDRRGPWRLETEGRPDVLFAVEGDPTEGDLARLGTAELAELHPVWTPLAPGAAAGGADEERAVGGELWRLFAGLCLVALLAESLYAAFLGRRRRVG